MPVNAEIQDILDFIESRNAPSFSEMSPEECREAMAKGRPLLQGDKLDLPRIENRTIPGPAVEIPIRIYADSSGTPLPVLVYLHGGGWVIGDLESHDDLCRRLARQAGCLVVSVDYRLAPEHKFPACSDDAFAATQWIAENATALGGDPTRLAVGGDSAGGNLTAVVCQMARDRGGPSIKFQLLIYPATAHDYSAPSMVDNAEGYFLTVKDMHYFYGHYLNGPAEADSPAVSPLNAQNLAGLPPAHVLTAEYDPLRDEGEAYGERLRESGVPVTMRRHEGTIHGFVTFTKTAISLQTIEDISGILRTSLAME